MNYGAAVQARTLATATKNGEYWTQADLNALFDLFDKGFKLEEIAEALKRTYYSVTGMHRMGPKNASEYVLNNRAPSGSVGRVLPYDVPSTSCDLGDGW